MLAGNLVGGFDDEYAPLMAGSARTNRQGLPLPEEPRPGKGCLCLKSLDGVDLDVLRDLIAESVRVRKESAA